MARRIYQPGRGYVKVEDDEVHVVEAPPCREPTAAELEKPLNMDWKYQAEWMADPAFRAWVWRQRQRPTRLPVHK